MSDTNSRELVGKLLVYVSMRGTHAVILDQDKKIILNNNGTLSLQDTYLPSLDDY